MEGDACSSSLISLSATYVLVRPVRGETGRFFSARTPQCEV